MDKKSQLIILSLLLKASSAYAEKKITFNEAIELAIKNNLEVQASYEAYQSSLYDKRSTQSNFFPKFSASLSYDKINTSTLATGASSTSETYMSSLNLSQNLFNGFSDYASLKIADTKILTAQADLQETKATISYDLKNATANYTYAKNSLLLSKDILKRREDNLRMVELRFQNGRENKGSVLLSRAYLEQAKLDFTIAQNEMHTSLIFLRRVLNLSEDESIEITDLPKIAEQERAEPNFDEIIENVPISKRFRAALKNANATLEIKKSRYYPTWDLNGSVGKMGTEFFPNDNKNWKIGTSLTWTFFDGGKDYYSATSANLLAKASEKRLENQKLELKRTLTLSYSSFSEAIQSVKVSRAFLEAAKVRSDISRSKYNNGLTSFDEWDTIESDLIIRQKDNITKIRNCLIAEASWEQAQGTGVIP